MRRKMVQLNAIRGRAYSMEEDRMRPCFQVSIVTPKRILLRGLWFGPKRSKRTIIVIHGLRSSAFSMLRIVDYLVDRHTAVLTFSNRGAETISDIIKLSKGTKRRSRLIKAGAAHEAFRDCADDVQVFR